MSEENEILLLMKELVDKVKALEDTVYRQDNLLMKSGFVVSTSPKPAMVNGAAPSSDVISKMDWDDIHKIVERIEG